jgi:UDP-N-acetylmuramyl pentapeptide phosphotransferase/UDP-N-acetylglucosamine-1-phosphate transferase
VTLIFLLFALSMTALGSWLLTKRFLDPDSIFHVLDHPNERSLHSRPTPRTGGLAILFALTTGTAIVAVTTSLPGIFFWIASGAILIATVSAIDDRLELGASSRLATHLAVATLVTLAGLMPAHIEVPGLVWHWPLWVAGVFTVLFIGWMINLYNFMDGMDGFAGGMAIVGFATYALMGALAAEFTFVWINLVVVFAVAGFLFFNFPPARIFMGDAGSSVLGYLAAAFALWGTNLGVFPLWVPVVVFAPFIIDATVTLLRRLLRGEKVWRAHKSHYYQRLVESGWGHRRTVMAEYGLMALCAVAALIALTVSAQTQWVIIAAVAAVFTGAMVWIDVKTGSKRPPAPRGWTSRKVPSELAS